MKRTRLLVIAGAALAAVSALFGAGAAFLYLAKPFQQWNVGFNEKSIDLQVEALQSLRDGKPEKAIQHLEFVGAHTLKQLAHAKQQGAETPQVFATSEAVKYLCSHPPIMPGAKKYSPPSVKESCAVLLGP